MAILQYVTRKDELRVDLESMEQGWTRVTLWSPKEPGKVYQEKVFLDAGQAMSHYYALASA